MLPVWTNCKLSDFFFFTGRFRKQKVYSSMWWWVFWFCFVNSCGLRICPDFLKLLYQRASKRPFFGSCLSERCLLCSAWKSDPCRQPELVVDNSSILFQKQKQLCVIPMAQQPVPAPCGFLPYWKKNVHCLTWVSFSNLKLFENLNQNICSLLFKQDLSLLECVTTISKRSGIANPIIQFLASRNIFLVFFCRIVRFICLSSGCSV